MYFGLTVSLVAHLALLGWALMSFQTTEPYRLAEPEPVEVAIISADELVRLRSHISLHIPLIFDRFLYDTIRSRRSVRESYLERLLELGEVSREEADEIKERRTRDLEEELEESRAPGFKVRGPTSGEGLWRPYRGGADREVPEAETAVEKEKLSALLRRSV